MIVNPKAAIEALKGQTERLALYHGLDSHRGAERLGQVDQKTGARNRSGARRLQPQGHHARLRHLYRESSCRQRRPPPGGRGEKADQAGNIARSVQQDVDDGETAQPACMRLARPGNDPAAGVADMSRPPRPVKAALLAAQFKDIVIDWNKSAMIIIDNFAIPKAGRHRRRRAASARTDQAAGEIVAQTARWRGAGDLGQLGQPADLANSPALRHVYNPTAGARAWAPLAVAPVPGARVLEKDSCASR